LKLLRGNRGHQVLNKNEPQPPIPPEPPEPPAFLSGYARDEWHRLAEGLHRLGLLTRLDVMTFSTYCTSIGRWVAAEQALAAMAERDPESGALTIRSATGCVMMNPLLRVAVASASDAVRYAAEFGLSPAARSRVAGGIAARWRRRNSMAYWAASLNGPKTGPLSGRLRTSTA
jgi:P27 family predicted phage terminase small subunit